MAEPLFEIRKHLNSEWTEFLLSELNAVFSNSFLSFLKTEYNNHVIYPKPELIFSAFNNTHHKDVKVVILGQDPYHGPNQANGLSFSINPGNKFPPSLRNIFKELISDLCVPFPFSGDLTPWSKQGVLLLNSILTVRQNSPGSHQKKGWEEFSDSVIKKLSIDKKNLVFILWGKYAEEKRAFIDESKHLVLTSSHPSPFSAHKDFFGSKPFSKSNNYFISKGIAPVEWGLPSIDNVAPTLF